jgi:hypothetical protein
MERARTHALSVGPCARAFLSPKTCAHRIDSRPVARRVPWQFLFLGVAVLVALAFGVWAWARDEPGTSEASPVSAQDESMARDVQGYFRHNAEQTSWYPEIESITVVGGVITITTSADLNATGGEVAGRRFTVRDVICSLVQASDVADFTPGHTVLGRDGDRAVCPARKS